MFLKNFLAIYYLYLSHHASQSHSWELLLIIHAHNLGTGSSTPLSTGLTLLSMGAKGLALQSSVAHDKQGQLSCFSDLRAMLPTCLWNLLPPATALRRAGPTPCLCSK